MDVVGLYSNITPGEGAASLLSFWETSDNKLVDGVLKNNIVEFDEKIFKQNVEPQEEQSLHLLMLFFSWDILRKKC